MDGRIEHLSVYRSKRRAVGTIRKTVDRIEIDRIEIDRIKSIQKIQKISRKKSVKNQGYYL